MQTGDRIQIFPDTDIQAYENLIHNMGFKCKTLKNSIVVGEPYRIGEKERKAIGNKITKGMKVKKLSRDDLAKKIGANPASIWNWQLGRIAPCEYYRKQLREILEIEI